MSKRRRGGTSGDNNYKESMTNTEQECHCSKTSRYHHKDSTYQNHSVDRCWTEPTPEHEWREAFDKEFCIILTTNEGTKNVGFLNELAIEQLNQNRNYKKIELSEAVKPDKVKAFIQNLLDQHSAHLVERIEGLKTFEPHIGIGHLHEAEVEAVRNQALDQAIGIIKDI
jgi:hypothetical protein